jgi:cytoskeletal protein CcmA (bactofilin family)
MNHPTELALMLFIDDAEEDTEATTKKDAATDAAGIATAPVEESFVAEHLAFCKTCQNTVAALRLEHQVIAAAMASVRHVAPSAVNGFRKPARLRDFTIATITAAFTTWLVQWSWKSLFEEMIFSSIARAAATWTPSLYSLANQLFLVFQEKGVDMFTDYLALVVVFVTLFSLVGLRGLWRKPGIVPALILVIGAGTTLMGITPAAHALQIIQDKKPVTIDATQTVDDTLIITARDVTVHGNVNGNLLIAGKDVEVTGRVSGNLVALAEDIQVSGNIDGMIVAAGDSLELSEAIISSDLWLAGDTIDVDADTDIGGNLTSASSSLDFAGKVGRDLIAAAERVSVSGSVTQDLRAAAKYLDIADAAIVGGNIIYRTDDAEDLSLSTDSTEQGTVDHEEKSEDIDLGVPRDAQDFYLWGLLWFVASFIVGWLALTVFPTLGTLQLGAGKDALKTTGMGFLVLVSVPVMVIVVGITIVGLPLSFIVLASWLVAWYLAKIVLAHLIGRSIFASRDNDPSHAASLFVGLAIITVAVNLPLIGSTLNLVATAVGLGLLAELWLGRATTPQDQAS